MEPDLAHIELMTALRARLRRALSPLTVAEANLVEWIDLPAEQLETLVGMVERVRRG